MSEVLVPRPARTRPTIGAMLWFFWMVGTWAAFFGLLLVGRLDGLWNAIRDLPLLAELALWVPFFPWMLGMAVWTSSWSGSVRVVLVVCFAVGWSFAFLPRRG